MTTKHTPGPWAVSLDHIFRNQSDIFEIHWSSIGECVAECVHGEANARLIAAAPEMLEALQRLYKDLPYVNQANGGMQARAAIAKATGETQ
jgi:hypothetical protein